MYIIYINDPAICNGIPVFLTTCSTYEETRKEIDNLLQIRFLNFLFNDKFNYAMQNYGITLSDDEADILFNLKIKGLSFFIDFHEKTKSTLDGEKYFNNISSIARKMINKRILDFQEFILMYAGKFTYKHIKEGTEWLYDFHLNKFIKYSNGERLVCSCNDCDVIVGCK